MVLERKYRRQVYRLAVVKEGNTLRFKLAGKTFDSLTAAAKHVTKLVTGKDQEMNGPLFWDAPRA